MFRLTITALLLLVSSCSSVLPKVSHRSWVLGGELTSEAEAKRPSLLEFLTGPPPAAVCPENGLLKLDDTIDEDSAGQLVRELEACKGRSVTLEINSPGGSVFAAMELQKAIERHDKPTFCVVDGLAASAAFVTLQSCTYRYATARSMLMAHEASMSVKGQSQELVNGTEALRVINWGMAETCSRRMGITHDEFEAHVVDGREWYFSQADALREHAIDAPADSVAAVAKVAGES